MIKIRFHRHRRHRRHVTKVMVTKLLRHVMGDLLGVTKTKKMKIVEN